MIVTMNSPAPVRAIIKMLAHEAAHRQRLAESSAAAAKLPTVLAGMPDGRPMEAAKDQARAQTALFLLACALREASLGEDGRWSAGQADAEREADELVIFRRARLNLDEVFARGAAEAALPAQDGDR